MTDSQDEVGLQRKSRNPVKKLRERKSAAVTAQPAKAALASDNGSSPSQPEALRKLYASLLRCRLVEERVRELASANSGAAPYDPGIGREAIVVGATADLGSGDTVTASPRHLAARIARGEPIRTLLADPANARPSSLAAVPEDPFNLGTGLALAHKLEQKRHVVVAFCPCQKPRLEDWHDALKFAAVHKLPIVFVIENGIAAETPGEVVAPHLEPLSFLARDYGFPGILVDGNDTVAVWRVAQESIHRARNGSGPTLIDCRTDSPHDPLAHMEHYLSKRSFWEDNWRQQVERQIRAEIEQPVDRAK